MPLDTRARRRARIMVAENDPTVQYRLTHMCYDHTTAFYPTDPHMTPTQRLPLAGTQLLPPRDASAQLIRSGRIRSMQGLFIPLQCSAVRLL